MGNYDSKTEKSQKHQSLLPINIAAGYVYNLYGSLPCKYLQKWKDLTKHDSSFRWQMW